MDTGKLDGYKVLLLKLKIYQLCEKPSPGVFLQVHVVTPVVLEGYKTIILSSVSLSCVLYLDHHFRLQLAILRCGI